MNKLSAALTVPKSPSFECSCGSSFSVAVVSDQFAGKKLLDRHKLVCVRILTPTDCNNSECGSSSSLFSLLQVNAALKEELKDIHALSIKKCWTVDQQAAALT